MNKFLKLQISRWDIVCYFILVAFLHPRGFEEYFASYKDFVTNMLYIAMALILLVFLYTFAGLRIQYKKVLYFVAAYYSVFFYITLTVQGGIADGKQKLLAAPALFLFCLMMLRENCKAFLRCLSNVLSVLFTLNLTFYNSSRWKDYFSASGTHILFIGHVQIASQLGILGLFVSYLIYRMNSKYKAGILILLSLGTMAMSGTSASQIAILIIVFVYLCFQVPSLRNRWLDLHPKWYVAFYVLMNLALLGFMVSLKGNYRLFGLDVSASGRMFIWKQALALITRKPWLGYGAYGVLIKVFWSSWTGDGLGMNHAHNELLQELLDGGIILLVLFILMLLAFVNDVARVEDEAARKYTNLFFIVFLIIMLAESVLGYYYFIIFLTIIAYIPEISVYFKQGKHDRRCK